MYSAKTIPSTPPHLLLFSTCLLLALLSSLHCSEKEEYAMSTYRNATDLKFQVTASYDNFDVINEGTTAATRGSSAAVKQFGSVLVNDRQAAQAELKRIADSVNTPLPQQPDAGDQDLFLEGLSGKAFDTAYLRETLLDHDSAIALYRDEAANGSYIGLLHYVNTYLPIIQSRRTEADSLLKVMEHP